MRKVFAQSKILVLVTAVCATGLLLGAGCPDSDILGPSKDPSSGTATGPTFQFTAPTARVMVTAGTPIGLSWTDSHPAGDATVHLFYDHDGAAGTGDETTITMMNEAAGTTSGGYAWNTTGMAMGVYRLAATIDDHTNPPLTRYSPYEVAVRDPGTGGGTDGTGLEPTLKMLQPATTLNPLRGTSIMIRWSVANAPAQAKLYLYYDKENNNPTNLNEQLIAVVGSGTGQIGTSDYGWTIPQDIPDGTYYILGRLTDGLGTNLSAYAPGKVQIGVGGGGTGAGTPVRELSQLGTAFPGAIFNGSTPGGRMGEVMTGGKDFNGDGYPDFILVAPQSFTTWKILPTGQDNMGEAYLVFSSGQTGRWAQNKPIDISTLGAYNNLEGVVFVGPAYSSTSSGIQEVIMIDDRDGDTRPEIVFGIPDVDRILEDQQDYDPLDSDTIHNQSPPAPAGWPAGFYYYQADGWQPFSTNPDGATNDWLVGPGTPFDPWTGAPNPGKRSGMIVYVSSQSGIINQTTLLDAVGGQTIWARAGNSRGIGMRLYPVASSDTSNWGAQLAVSDLFAKPVFPALLVARPEHAGGTGSVKILVQESMDPEFKAWTEDPNFGNWETTPDAWTFPAADSYDNNGDPDRLPAWPTPPWYDFMDSPYNEDAPPQASNFDIMNSDAAVAAGGHLGRPTNLKDFNRDTFEDVAVSSPDASPGGLAQAGTAYVVYGSRSLTGVDVRRFGQGNGPGFELAGTEAGEQLGWRMAGPGDLNGDHYNDWVLAAPKRDWASRADCGAVVIVYGRLMLYGRHTVDEVIPDLGGAIIYGERAGDNLGMYMASLGDVDRDGYPDFAVSAPGYDGQDKQNCGAVYLIYGGPHLVGEFDIAAIGTTQLPGKIYIGPEANAAVGPVAAAGDVDQDFYADFLIAYPGYSPNPSQTAAGRVWLVYGSRKEAQ